MSICDEPRFNGYVLSDEVWEIIEPLCMGKAGGRGRTGKDNRKFVIAVLYITRAGCPWSHLPPEPGKHKNVHKRFMRWARQGVWEKIFNDICKIADKRILSWDSTINRAHQHSAGAKYSNRKDESIERSSFGLSTKVHAECDTNGKPTQFYLTPGQSHDLNGADEFIKNVNPEDSTEAVVADRAYDADERVIDPLYELGVEAVIRPKSSRRNKWEYNKILYKTRHKIENLFCTLKQSRGIATRYSKTKVSYLACIHLAAAVTWLR